jgi:hypothetical protein
MYYLMVDALLSRQDKPFITDEEEASQEKDPSHGKLLDAITAGFKAIVRSAAAAQEQAEQEATAIFWRQVAMGAMGLLALALVAAGALLHKVCSLQQMGQEAEMGHSRSIQGTALPGFVYTKLAETC